MPTAAGAASTQVTTWPAAVQPAGSAPDKVRPVPSVSVSVIASVVAAFATVTVSVYAIVSPGLTVAPVAGFEVLATPVVGPRGAKDGRALFDVGQDLLACNELDRAARAFLEAAEAGRREGTSLYNAACARALESRNAEALDLLERAVAAGFDGAGHLRRDDDLDGLRAEPRFERIAKDAEALSLGDFPSLGARLLRSQMVTEADEAAARFEAFLRTNPRSGRAWWSIGKVRLTAGQDREAVHAFTRALSLGYRRGATAYDLACAHARLKERDAAFARLFEAIDLGAATADHVEGDDDLWNLRRDPRFEEAVARARRARGGR